MPGYHSLIRAHGVIAAIVFLFIVPAAIFTLRFHTGNTRRAIRIHICLQILTVLLTTVLFILPWFAVGPKRSLTNPHHGIGLAIFVLVLTQAIGGWWVNRRDKRRRTLHTPLTAMVSSALLLKLGPALICWQLHHWTGRMIALLGLAQIPLGLTLYGSPVVLFVLYALVVFVLLLIYFIFTYMRDRRDSSDYDSRYSYGSGSVVEDRRRRSRTGDIIKGGAAGVGIAALANKLRNRSKSRDRYDRPEVVGSRRHSGSYVDDEKYHSDDEERGGGWRDRLLTIGALGGAAAAAKSFFNRRRDRDRDSDVADYGPPLGGDVPITGGNSVSRVDQSRPIPSGQHPLNQPLHHRRSSSSMTYSSLISASQEGRHGHGVRDAVAGLGAFGLARNILKKRRERKEAKRLEKQMEDERRDRERNQRLTGDGTHRRNRHHGRHASLTSTSLTGDSDPYPGTGPILGNPAPPVPAGVFPGAAGTAAGSPQHFNRNRQPPLPPQHNVTQPLPPQSTTNVGANNSVMTGAPPPVPPGQQVTMPPIPPDPQGILHQNYSESDSSASAQPRPRRGGRDATEATVAGGAAGLAAAEASRRRDRSRHQSGSAGGSPASPPVSVKVKMHSDGRHVTLRRLPEDEAAAEREARRKSRDRNGRRRRGSASSASDTGGDRWRRTEALERQQAEQMRMESERLAAARRAQQQPMQPQQSNLQVPLPPAPPIPEGSPRPPGAAGSVGSPGTYDGNVTGTENSADYANNRRRRRAERAQARLAKEGRPGGNVEFT